MAKLLSPLLLLRLKSGQRQCKMGRFHVLGWMTKEKKRTSKREISM
jgi:hypothetical protein